jgi:acetyl esterase
VQRFLRMLAVGGMPDVTALEPQAARAAFLRLAEVVDIKDVPVAHIDNRTIPGPLGPLPIRIYSPLQANAAALPGIVYFHGGAWVFCNLDTHDGLCRVLANESGARVVAVDYHQAPEHKLPAIVEESYAAMMWLAEHARELGIEPHRLAIAGDSAGGTLAAVVCQLIKQRSGPELVLQLLLCPKTDVSRQSASRQAFGKGYFFDSTILEWALKHACPSSLAYTDTRISPLLAVDLAGLPAAHVHTAEFDPLRDEGKAYADRLQRAGTSVRYACHAGMIHHFYGMAGIIPAARAALEAIGLGVKEALTAPQLSSPSTA